ncbi:MAG: hypothetical protein J6T10_13470 [Methanobrevibacter sp.]|nr:hypothetical protein [Methanobrevibacter sp.]
MNYTLEGIKATGNVTSSLISTDEEIFFGEFNIRINCVTIFSDKVVAHKGKKLAFVYLYRNNSAVATYTYDLQSKELI